MDEKQIAEAMGVTLPPLGGEAAAGLSGPEARLRQESGGQTGESEKAAASAGQTEEPAHAAERAEAESGEEAGQAQLLSAENMGASEGAPTEAELQTEEQRRENAARRRRQEQQEAIDRAVSAALDQERERTKGEWAAFFAKAGLKNSITGAPITSLEEFNQWSQAYDAARLSDDLKEGKLTPEALDRAIAENPAVKRAEEIIRKEEESRRQQEEAAAKARIDAEIAEIHKLDPTVSSMEDLLRMPNARQFYEYVRRGNSFLDAWYLANREKLAEQTAQAAKQQAMSAARSKEHLTATANARGAGAASVPAEDMRMFRLFNPEATEAEIQAYYNKQKKG